MNVRVVLALKAESLMWTAGRVTASTHARPGV